MQNRVTYALRDSIATITLDDGKMNALSREMLAEIGPDSYARPQVFVCGPTSFVETVAAALVQLGHQPKAIKTERFGATGG